MTREELQELMTNPLEILLGGIPKNPMSSHHIRINRMKQIL